MVPPVSLPYHTIVPSIPLKLCKHSGNECYLACGYERNNNAICNGNINTHTRVFVYCNSAVCCLVVVLRASVCLPCFCTAYFAPSVCFCYCRLPDGMLWLLLWRLLLLLLPPPPCLEPPYRYPSSLLRDLKMPPLTALSPNRE